MSSKLSLHILFVELLSGQVQVALQAQAFRRNDGGGQQEQEGKWRNKWRNSSEGPKVPNQNSGGNNYKKNGGHGNFNKKGGKQKKEDEAQMTQGDSDDSYSDYVLLM
ncbi:hypothetical protein CR513_32226, partial [Mucuna pruriens]